MWLNTDIYDIHRLRPESEFLFIGQMSILLLYIFGAVIKIGIKFFCYVYEGNYSVNFCDTVPFKIKSQTPILFRLVGKGLKPWAKRTTIREGDR